jgi:hypothetical protein
MDRLVEGTRVTRIFRVNPEALAARVARTKTWEGGSGAGVIAAEVWVWADESSRSVPGCAGALYWTRDGAHAIGLGRETVDALAATSGLTDVEVAWVLALVAYSPPEVGFLDRDREVTRWRDEVVKSNPVPLTRTVWVVDPSEEWEEDE